MAALLRAKSNHVAFCSTPSKLWSSGAYWWVCRILWVSYKQVHICFTFSGVPIFQKLEKATDQRNLKTGWDCVFEHRSNCLVPERAKISVQWNLCGELGISGALGAVKSHLFMVITEKVFLHLFAEQEHCFGWCQVKLWIEWELYTVPLRNKLVWSGSTSCSRNRWKQQWRMQPYKGKNKWETGEGGPFPLGRSLNSVQNAWFLGLKLGRKGGFSLDYLCFVPGTFPATVYWEQRCVRKKSGNGWNWMEKEWG